MSKKHCLRSTRRLTGGLAASFAIASPASATSDAWTGASDALWSHSGNWLGGSVPGAGDTATFNASSSNTTTDLDAGVTLGALLFDTSTAAAHTIGAGGAAIPLPSALRRTQSDIAENWSNRKSRSLGKIQ